MAKQFTQQEIDAAYNSAPEVIQEALETDPYMQFAMDLQSNYKLHIDTADKVIGEMRNLLLGLITPTEFVSNLSGYGIPSATVHQIASDLNAQVFKPLQERVLESGDDEKNSDRIKKIEAIESVPVQDTSVPPPAPQPVKMPEPTPAPQPAPTLAQTPAYMSPAPAPSVSQFSQVPLESQIPGPQKEFIRTMNADEQAVQKNQEPQMRPYTPPTQSAPTQSAAQPQNMPQQPAAPAPRPAPTPAPRAPQQSNPNRDALHDVLKEYGIDPYREPIE